MYKDDLNAKNARLPDAQVPPQPATLNPQPSTLNPQPSTLFAKRVGLPGAQRCSCPVRRVADACCAGACVGAGCLLRWSLLVGCLLRGSLLMLAALELARRRCRACEASRGFRGLRGAGRSAGLELTVA